MSKIGYDDGKIRFPSEKAIGMPVDPSKVPSYEMCLELFLRIEKCLKMRGKGAARYHKEAMDLLREVNGYEVWTSNILNAKGGLFPISVGSKGGCCDPGTESYHSM